MSKEYEAWLKVFWEQQRKHWARFGPVLAKRIAKSFSEVKLYSQCKNEQRE